MAAFLFLSALSFVVVGVWRGLIYDLSVGAWAIAAVVAVAGMALVYKGFGRRRQTWEVALLAIPMVLELFRNEIGLTPEASVPLVLFSAGSYFALFNRLTADVISRKRTVRRWLAEIGALDPHVRAELDAYLRARGELEGRVEPERRELARALRKLSRRPDASWRAAADALRTFETAVGNWLRECEALPIPACLREKDDESTQETHELRRECRRFAEALDAGRLDKTALEEANRRVLNAAREWQYAVGELARHHRVSVPRWFLKLNCELAKAG